MKEKLPALSRTPEKNLRELSYIEQAILLLRNVWSRLVYRILSQTPSLPEKKAPLPSEGNKLLDSIPDTIPGGRVEKIPRPGAKYLAIIIRQAHLNPKSDISNTEVTTQFDTEDPLNSKIKQIQEDIEKIILFFCDYFNIGEVFAESMMIGDEHMNNIGEEITTIRRDLEMMRDMLKLLESLNTKHKKVKIKETIIRIQEISKFFSPNGETLPSKVIQKRSSEIILALKERINCLESNLEYINFILDHDASLRLVREKKIELKPSRYLQTMRISNFFERSWQREEDALNLMRLHLEGKASTPAAILTMGAAHNMKAACERINGPFALAIVTPNSYHPEDFAEYLKMVERL